MIIGLVGKPNAGKSTFFSAITNMDTKIANYPFTTIDPKKASAYIKSECIHVSLNLNQCNAKNSICKDKFRYIPIQIIDIAGIVPDAHKGKGLGLQFLNDLNLADCLIHVVDISGTTDLQGNQGKENNVIDEVLFLRNELNMWFYEIIKKNWNKIRGKNFESLLLILSGLKVDSNKLNESLEELNLNKQKIDYSDEEILKLSELLRKKTKPIIIVANKMDLKNSKDNLNKLKYHFEKEIIIPCFSQYELVLKKAENSKIIKRKENDFEIISGNMEQKKALESIKEKLKEFNFNTGLDDTIKKVAFDLLDLIIVYPVEDENKFTDKFENILPDAILLKKGSTPKDLAYKIHTELGDKFITAIDAKKKIRISKEYELKNNDVVKIISG